MVIKARKKLLGAIESGNLDYKVFQEIVLYDQKLREHNIEQLAAKMLFDLTRNTGFEVSKKSIGACWTNSCCEWKERMSNDICGLNDNKLSLAEKMEHIYKGTSLQKELAAIGLEVLS